MRLVRDENPREIGDYAHVKPAPIFGPIRCFVKFPGRRFTCTLSQGHDGHGFFKKVMAVWDE